MPSPNEDDSDLEDLLTSKTASPPTTTTEDVNIDLDHLTREGDIAKNKKKQQHYSHHNPSVSPSMFCYAHCCTFVTTHPCTCAVLLLMIGVAIAVALINIAFNPTSEIGVVQHDYSAVQSSFQLSMGNVDHWCLMGDDDSCTCEDPLEPTHRGESKSWRRAHKANMETVEEYRDEVGLNELDVAIIGESVVELMDGRWMGAEDRKIKELYKEFKRRFWKEKGADIQGVALGIAGDTSPNILWRLQRGEMPSDFNPTVFWIVAGMNDLARTQCSEEVTVIGILRLVEEILERKPNAQIVLNSLFPMLDLREGYNPHHADMEDAYRERPHRGHWWRGNHGRDVPGSHFAHDPTMVARLREKEARNSKNGHEDDRHLRHLHERHLADSESGSGDGKKRKKKNKKEPINPKLQELMKHVFRHRDPMSLFTHRRNPPLWPAVEAINAELKRFCQKHPRVHFVDSTELFILNANTAHGDKRLNSDLISWRGRPNLDGFKVWEDSIVEKVKYLLAKEGAAAKKETPVEENEYSPSEEEKQEEGDDAVDEDADDEEEGDDADADDEGEGDDADADDEEGDDADADDEEGDDADADDEEDGDDDDEEEGDDDADDDDDDDEDADDKEEGDDDDKEEGDDDDNDEEDN